MPFNFERCRAVTTPVAEEVSSSTRQWGICHCRTTARDHFICYIFVVYVNLQHCTRVRVFIEMVMVEYRHLVCIFHWYHNPMTERMEKKTLWNSFLLLVFFGGDGAWLVNDSHKLILMKEKQETSSGNFNFELQIGWSLIGTCPKYS